MAAVLPTSRDTLRIKLSAVDAVWAALTPYLALVLGNALILSANGTQAVAIYWLTTFGFSLFAFVALRLRDGMAHYFSVHDAIDIAKAVIVAELLTCALLFFVTRLDGVPRSTPIIHALVLSLGLVTVRVVTRCTLGGKPLRGDQQIARHHVIVIGVNRLSSLYMKFLDAIAPGTNDIIAVLDDAADTWGCSINGVHVIGPPSHLELIVEEFAIHGVQVERVVVGFRPDEFPDGVLYKIRHVCARHNIELGFVPELFGLTRLHEPELLTTAQAQREASFVPEPPLALPIYFKAKRYVDFVEALILLLVLGPFWLGAAAITVYDVGVPVFFWQQRMGLRGRRFLLYKFRTLRAPFDESGRKLSDDERLSPIGRFMRRSRLDELPQLLNILVGDMSLIGPRPLLPRDQPKNVNVRLLVRPGVTGWAQVNGGTLLSAEEKELLDEWYIRNASLWLDLRIMLMTVVMVFRGDHLRSSQIEPGANNARKLPRPDVVARPVSRLLHAREPSRGATRAAHSPRHGVSPAIGQREP
jgi:lipopolysaccharide/colanic/teichoic acid biosynthesis glycosyltransferase